MKNIGKRVLTLLLALGLIGGALFLPASAATFSGVAREGVTWEYDTATETLTISGAGIIDFSYMSIYSTTECCPPDFRH